MKLFSKRYNQLSYRELGGRMSSSRRHLELVSSEVRTRLVAEIEFLSSSDDYLEWFILFENERLEKIYFDENKVDHFTQTELGYKMSQFFEFETFAIVEQDTVSRVREGEMILYYDDMKLFDLIEMVILFAKKNSRDNLIARFNSIFHEEKSDFEIQETLITKRTKESLKSLSKTITDDALSMKIEDYYYWIERGDYKNGAKSSSDILNIIFSDITKDNKKTEIEAKINKTAELIVSNKKKQEFKDIMNSALTLSKNLSNQIYDIRHTEKSTIVIKNENIYKMVATYNMGLVEFFLTSIKDEFLVSEDWEEKKQEYIAKYNINPNIRLTIRKSPPPSVELDEDEIDLEEIPF